MIVKGNPLGMVVQVLLLVPAGVGLVGAVYVSDVLGWGRLAGALLCLFPGAGLGLGLCLFVAFRTRLHSTRIWVKK